MEKKRRSPRIVAAAQPKPMSLAISADLEALLADPKAREPVRPTGRFVCLRNGGNECYMLAVFQALNRVDSVREYFCNDAQLRADFEASETAECLLASQFAQVIRGLAAGNADVLSIASFCVELARSQRFTYISGVMEDASEFLTALFAVLGEVCPRSMDAFRGEKEAVITCTAGHANTRKEDTELITLHYADSIQSAVTEMGKIEVIQDRICDSCGSGVRGECTKSTTVTIDPATAVCVLLVSPRPRAKRSRAGLLHKQSKESASEGKGCHRTHRRIGLWAHQVPPNRSR
jgi:ubiquitin C-terminal hydrolase